jgi:hypothetical protein
MMGGCGAIPVKTIELALIEKVSCSCRLPFSQSLSAGKETNIHGSIVEAHGPEGCLQVCGERNAFYHTTASSFHDGNCALLVKTFMMGCALAKLKRVYWKGV